MADNGELEGHLKDRLGEVRDVANFTRSRPQGTPEGQEVGREIVIEGAEHLGGRKVKDTFLRGGGKAQGAPVPTPEELDPRSKKLEHHLKSRISEVQDVYPAQSGLDAQLAKLREQRKNMGGGKGP